MAEPQVLEDMDRDERQDLKEAICDAILERTRKVVSGEGIYGTIILGAKPSRTLSSGFILPRLNEDGDDESSDIRIATHGMDVRIRHAQGTIRIQPTYSVYVRALPTVEELFDRNGRLIPRADFNEAARAQVRAAIAQRAANEIPPNTPQHERASRRAIISREVHIAMGVGVPENAQLPGGDERAEEADNIPPSPVFGGRLRIPSSLSRTYDTPPKWIRLSVNTPSLELPLPCDAERWEAITSAYKQTILQSIRNTYDVWIASPDGQNLAWRNIRPPSEAFWEPEAWNRFLTTVRATPPNPADLIPVFDVQLLIQTLLDPLEANAFSVRIALENLQEDDAAKECGLFGVSITAEIPTSALGPIRLERVRRSYHLAGFMTMPAIGVNGGVTDLGEQNRCRILQTSWMPRYVLPRILATRINEVPTAYAVLAANSTSLIDLLALPNEMENWIHNVEENTVLFSPDEEGTPEDEEIQRIRFQDDLHAWRAEAARIRSGIQLLARAQEAWRTSSNTPEAIPYRAWLLLNQSFAAANPRRGGEEAGWRLFQLAFVLSHIPTFASRITEYNSTFNAAFDEDSASLLYMSTGGGKTEAFFGTLVYALFLDRLRGKHRGVTAMMHYPLRLLTVQQAQRLSRLLARAEIVRRQERVPGSPFEIGFWVGGTNTPNRTETTSNAIEENLRCIPVWNHPRARDEDALLNSQEKIDREYVAAKNAWNKLPICPFCGSEHGTGLRLFPALHHRLGIVCLNGDCEWNQIHSTNAVVEPLPFLLADTDIYRRAPSVLLGTIDKLALLGQNTHTVDRIAGMFGMARWIEGGPNGLLHMPNGTQTGEEPPPGHTRVAPAYSDGDEIFFDPFPSLIIQDEMHLLEESLGTFGGIFETGLFAWLSRLAPLLGSRAVHVPGAPERPRLPHVIGATATASDVAKHTQALYQRNVVQFPHPGPSLHGGFYTRLSQFASDSASAAARTTTSNTAREREIAAPWGRIYCSLMTNGRLHTVTTLSVLSAHAATITRWQRDLSAADRTRQTRAAQEIEANISDVIGASSRREAVRVAINSNRYDRLAALVDLHRIQLTYVTNKKGGDQILSALTAEVQEAHAAMGPDYDIDVFDMQLISGGVDIGGIQSVIAASERPFNPMTDDINETLRGIVATSAISHGVDVETFNAMTFAGMPSDIAEYIQASSRVGRTHVGFSLLIPTPQTRRDRFVVEVHESFHRLLERMISPPAVERWAERAIERTIPSLIQTWLAGVWHQERFVAAPVDQKASIFLPTTVDGVDRILRNPQAFNDCVQFVTEAVGVNTAVGGPANPHYYENLIRAGLLRVQTVLSTGEFVGKLSEFWSNQLANMQRPMTSLRDVDIVGRIIGSRRTRHNQSLSLEDIANAMAIIRNRGMSRQRRSSTSELDTEA